MITNEVILNQSNLKVIKVNFPTTYKYPGAPNIYVLVNKENRSGGWVQCWT